MFTRLIWQKKKQDVNLFKTDSRNWTTPVKYPNKMVRWVYLFNNRDFDSRQKWKQSWSSVNDCGWVRKTLCPLQIGSFYAKVQHIWTEVEFFFLENKHVLQYHCSVNGISSFLWSLQASVHNSHTKPFLWKCAGRQLQVASIRCSKVNSTNLSVCRSTVYQDETIQVLNSRSQRIS